MLRKAIFTISVAMLTLSLGPVASAHVDSSDKAVDKTVDRTSVLIVKLSSSKSQASSKSFAADSAALFERFAVRGVTPLFAAPAPKRRRDVRLENVYRLELAPGVSVDDAAAAFARRDDVAYAEPVVAYEVQITVDDPFFFSSGSWGQPYQDLWGLYLVGAPFVWDVATGQGVVVAVTDTGTDLGHPDLAANLWQNSGEIAGNGLDDDGNGYVDDVFGYDFVDGDPTPQDGHGHGTHVAGTVAAVAGNGLGIAGVAPGARIMSLKGLDDGGTGYSDDLARAIVYAAENGADVLNMSWGGGVESQLITDALAAAHDAGVVAVAAAGNNYGDAADFHPAASRYVLTVGAVDHDEVKSDFSNSGWSIDVTAPGGDSADASATKIYNNVLSLRSSEIGAGGINDPDLVVGGDYLRLRGTSMAAPHVSGLVAVLRELLPGATPEQIRQRLRHSAIPGPSGWNSQTGFGLAAASAVVSTAPLGEARIFEPRPTTYTGSSLDVVVSAGGPAFLSYDLAQGDGDEPQSFAHVGIGGGSPVARELVGTLDVSDWIDGPNTLRLSAVADGFLFRDRVVFELDRVEITSPVNRYRAEALFGEYAFVPFRGDEPVEIRGSAAGGGFSRYRLEHRRLIVDGSWGTWSDSGMTLAGGGLSRVSDGLLGAWDPAAVGAIGAFEIRLVVERDSLPAIVETTRLIIDPTIAEGWPQAFNFQRIGGRTAAFITPVEHQATAADVDGDGRSELLIGYWNTARIYRGDGTVAPGWPQVVGAEDVFLDGSMAVGDLDGDGDAEIVASTRGPGTTEYTIRAWHHDGSPHGLDGLVGRLPVVLDADGDGSDEVVIVTSSGLDLVDGDGRSLTGWPRSVAATPQWRPAVGDVDGDGVEEIVLLDVGRRLRVFELDGSTAPGWPVTVATARLAWQENPVLGDLDGDGTLEIVLADGDCKVFVFHHDGSTATGWPLQLPDVTWRGGAVSLGDLDGDERPEILAGGMIDGGYGSTRLFALNAAAEILPGWPVGAHPGAVIVDADGDGRRDVLAYRDTSWGSHPDYFDAYNADGTFLADFPKRWPDGFGQHLTPAVADYDGDGLFEVAAVTSKGDVLMWDLPGPARPSPADWLMFDHDARHSAAWSDSRGPARPTLTVADRVPASAQAPVAVRIELDNGGEDLASLAFSIDFDADCLAFDPSDPDALRFDIPPAFSVSVAVDLADTDGEIDVLIFDIPPQATLPSGTLGTMTFTPTCAPVDEAIVVFVGFSEDPAPSFGTVEGTSVAGDAVDGSVEILPGLPGDCNGDGRVDAGDVSACGLEVFDGDGSFWLDAGGGTFPGRPTGCDANRDTRIDAGDVSCKGLLIFDPSAGCAAARAGAGMLPRLVVTDVPASGDRAVVPVELRDTGASINSVAFRLRLDPALGLDPTDADHDGVPDSVRLLVSANTVHVSYDAGRNELDVLLANLGATPDPFAEGGLLELEIGLEQGVGGSVGFANDPEPSFGAVDGSSVEGTARGGKVLGTNVIFCDDFESGTASQWSQR